MQPINLLPKDLTPKKSVLKLSTNIRRVSIIGFCILFISVIVSIGIIFMLSREINASKQRQQELVAKITSYEQTEQKLILVKDRLDKAGLVLNSASALPEIEVFSKLLSLFPEGVLLDQASMTTEGTQVNLLVPSSSLLVKIFADLLSSDIYHSVQLIGFNYQIGEGYRISLNLKT